MQTAEGSVDVVIKDGDTVISTLGTQFTYISTLTPTVTEVTPTAGSPKGTRKYNFCLIAILVIIVIVIPLNCFYLVAYHRCINSYFLSAGGVTTLCCQPP